MTPRIASLLPGATEAVAALGLAGALVGRSHECDHPPEVADLPVVTVSHLDPDLDAAGIDRAVRAAARAGRSLQAVDAGRLRALRPDVVVTQDLCDVCAVSADGLVADLPPGVRVVRLGAGTLAGVWDDMALLGAALGVPDRGAALRDALARRVADVAAEATPAARPPGVVVLEWLDPPYTAGHWVPDMVAAAGGRELLASSGSRSRVADPAEVEEARPDVVVVAPCGMRLPAAVAAARGLPPAWTDPRRSWRPRIAAVDADAFLSRPGPRLAEGVEVLRAALAPGGRPDGVRWARVAG